MHLTLTEQFHQIVNVTLHYEPNGLTNTVLQSDSVTTTVLELDSVTSTAYQPQILN